MKVSSGIRNPLSFYHVCYRLGTQILTGTGRWPGPTEPDSDCQLVFKVQCTVNSHISPLGFFSAML